MNVMGAKRGLLLGVVVAAAMLARPSPVMCQWVFPGATWQAKTVEEMGMDRSKLDAFKTKCGTASSGVVVKDGYLVYTWNNYTTNHNWASASKPVISTLLFSAINEGRVASVDSLIYDWGWALTPEDRTMTFRHLADMTSGYAVAEAPGQAWSYNDYAIHLYIDTLDKVLDPNHSDHLVTAGNARLRDPMQFQDGTLFESNKGRVRSSARDFARMGWLWMNKGNWNGTQLVPASFFDNYMKADVPANLPQSVTSNTDTSGNYLGLTSYGGGVNQGSEGPGIYGFNWWFNTNRDTSQLTWPSAPGDTFLANGRDGKDCMAMVPSLGLVVAAWNDDVSAWGGFVPGDSGSFMNQGLSLLVQAVPEPTSLVLLGVGAFTLMRRRRRKSG